MIKLTDKPVWLLDGKKLSFDYKETGGPVSVEEGRQGTMAYSILKAHNTSDDMSALKIRFDKLISHDITYVGIIQTARASGLEKFPIPYALTCCHNSLCAVGGTINEDDHIFGLTCAQKYGGIFVPPHQAVIHQFAREMMAEGGAMILGSDSHTRYGALGTMGVGEGGGELAKQLLNKTYDVNMPEIVCVYLTGSPAKGVGPQDVALAIEGAVFDNGFVKNRVMEFTGPGIAGLSADFRIGIDVMTTETTCLSSIWQTDSEIQDFYTIHGRSECYKEIRPADVAYYDRLIEIDLSTIRPMIAMPVHPSSTYSIEEFQANMADILHETEERAKVSLSAPDFTLQDKVRNGRFYVEQGIIAGCAGGGFENICAAADILRGGSIGSGEFTLSVYPASMPVYMELVKNGTVADLLAAGAVMKTAFCGPCFGAGDTPSNGAFSIRHSTRNFPNREGSKPGAGQVASVALMDARSIAATAANKGFLTAATEIDVNFNKKKYFFDSSIYENRVFNGLGKADPDQPIKQGPNIKDWPEMSALPKNLVLKVVSEIHDPVTTTDELIPSGETSSYRSNPLGLAEFTLSRKDPDYVGEAKKVRDVEAARSEGKCQGEVLPEFKPVKHTLMKYFSFTDDEFGIGSTIYAVKPGDGSAREQAASCQKVLGGWANIAHEYATKRYRSNLINWGMVPFIFPEMDIPFGKGDWIYIPDIAAKIAAGDTEFTAYVVNTDAEINAPTDCTAAEGIADKKDPENTADLKKITLKIDPLTDDEKDIILKGCLINYYRA